MSPVIVFHVEKERKEQKEKDNMDEVSLTLELLHQYGRMSYYTKCLNYLMK